MAKRILILGGTGMLGHMLFMQLLQQKNLNTYATARSSATDLRSWFPDYALKKIRPEVDADNFDSVIRAFAAIRPDVVINCIGLIKQTPLASDPLSAIVINTLLPHRISMICRTAGARLIHMSTDCVFSGARGDYSEQDISDAVDLYGRSKFLGEVSYRPHCITLRTSIIGHELKGKLGLVEWFLSQKKKINGYTNAIFSGFPTIELAHIIIEYILPNQKLKGIYHVSSEPISKYDLLKLISERYVKKTEIKPYGAFRQDRSLNSSLFRRMTGYSPPPWSELIDKMYRNYMSSNEHS
jgi:dTDP-4-dehydrorhamnose reductase